ncbi:hypothetical protein A1D23_05975 [Chelonobacter oris]|uniref:Uncharacterized protein n=1 Tax=Chelonobacter oris TaxID=505317 RepID=A0A0A3AT20_9PAST|nr:hypothetical protein [Chelonobacter oris]KGQ70185.1 hypothetical protein OA57_07590 [Chelonobacter oris]MDH2999640.1 hypothetical protein [Chelonobacter oris]
MPVNFIKIFQDSWNFMLNQRQTVLFFLVLLIIDNLFFRYLLDSPNLQSEETSRSVLLILLASQVVNAILVLWLLSVITLISRQQQPNLVTALSYGIKKMPFYLLLNLVIVLPFSLAAASYFNQQSSIFSLLSMLIGAYLFIRLCLAPYSYIIENSSFTEALKLVWLNGVGRVLPLFLFSLLVYLLPLLITLQLSRLAPSLLTTLGIAVISALISLFTLVFSYRFYQLFIDKTALRKFQ